MTRFALIPLAFFANACASAEDVQEDTQPETSELRAAFDEIGSETDRRSATVASSYGLRVVHVVDRMFRNELDAAGCKYVAAAVGSWHYYPANISLNVFDIQGTHELHMSGVMHWEDNSSGEITMKGYSQGNNEVVKLEADWLDNSIEGDMSFSSDESEYRFFGAKVHRGPGGLAIGAIGVCN